MVSNDQRIDWADECVEIHALRTNSSEEPKHQKVRDLLTNLCHLLESEGIEDVQNELNWARLMYEIEAEEDA